MNFRFPLEILKKSEFTWKIGHRHRIVLGWEISTNIFYVILLCLSCHVLHAVRFTIV